MTCEVEFMRNKRLKLKERGLTVNGNPFFFSKECVMCGNGFIALRDRAKYCSKECRTKSTAIWNKSKPEKRKEYYRRGYKPIPKTVRACNKCGAEYKTASNSSVYCPSCRNETIKICDKMRRIRLKGSTIHRTYLREYKKQHKNFTCYYCGEKFSVKRMTVDHVIPISRGGLNEPSNWCHSCFHCNSRKSNLNPTLFIERKNKSEGQLLLAI
jgi:5-methylcytosine-specific restriction endonuclease McrA